MTITKDLTIEEIFTKFPQKSQRLGQEMTNFGLHCVGCSAATWETLEAGVLGHGKSEEELNELIGRLNAVLEETIITDKIIFTKTAANKVRSVLKEDGKKGWGIRLSEKASGCSGYEYCLDFSEKSNEEDEVFVSEEIEIHVKKTDLKRLLGCVIDFMDGLQGAGFKITNPNVQSSCGCGSSHGY